MAETAPASSGFFVVKMTAALDCLIKSLPKSAKPPPSRSKSSRIRSGWKRIVFSSASAPSSARRRRFPSAFKNSSKKPSKAALSPTTSVVKILFLGTKIPRLKQPVFRGRAASCQRLALNQTDQKHDDGHDQQDMDE